jgi:hypothetical protein
MKIAAVNWIVYMIFIDVLAIFLFARLTQGIQRTLI